MDLRKEHSCLSSYYVAACSIAITPNVYADELYSLPYESPTAVRSPVDEDIAGGADIIKLFVVSWVSRDGKHVPVPMSLAVAQAATTEAHRKASCVFAHPSTND